MTRHFMLKIKSFAGALAAAILMLTATSCNNPVFDYEGDCDPHYYLQFVFDRNMHYNDNHGIGADAFAAQVGSVDVYFFDEETGQLALHLEENGAALREHGYRMSVDIAPGKYEIIAWCGLHDNDNHFSLKSDISERQDLTCRMSRKTDAENGTVFSDDCLNPLFHGSIVWDMPNHEGEYVETIYLTKDTNYIQLALQQISGELDPEQFDVTIEDANGYLAHNNSLLADDLIQYRPWSKKGGIAYVEQVTRSGETEETEGVGTGFMVAELATSRLMADRQPILTVTDKTTNQTVFSLDLVKYIKMMKSERYSYMDDQEYLDRQDEYSVMVFLENNGGWRAVQIVINSWRVVDNGNVGL